jgi:hypothetical protein
LKFALRKQGWSRDVELPPYCQRCRLIDLAVLSSRRRVSCALFISDVLSCKLDCVGFRKTFFENISTFSRLEIFGSSEIKKIHLIFELLYC